MKTTETQRHGDPVTNDRDINEITGAIIGAAIAVNLSSDQDCSSRCEGTNTTALHEENFFVQNLRGFVANVSI